jgi:hypothetical protein
MVKEPATIGPALVYATRCLPIPAPLPHYFAICAKSALASTKHTLRDCPPGNLTAGPRPGSGHCPASHDRAGLAVAILIGRRAGTVPDSDGAAPGGRHPRAG